LQKSTGYARSVTGWDLVGVPYTSMARPGGIATAIDVLRAVGLGARLGAIGIRDAGDMELEAPSGERGPSRLLNERGLSRLVETTRDVVSATRRRDRSPLLVGGDYPVLLGALAALADSERGHGPVMIDGHEDAWPPELSETGEASDSELAIALGRVSHLPPPLAELTPLVDPEHVALLGPRDASAIAEGGATSVRAEVGCFLDDKAVADKGGEQSMAAALAAIGHVPFWLHVDLDVLATADFAAVDYQQAGGLRWHELEQLVAAALADPRSRGASIVIYNPDLDPDRSEAARVVDFVTRTIERLAP
jgi:arginase